MEQLRRNNKPIKQVALAVGFRNEKSFARAFRQWTGVSPGEFRRGQLPDKSEKALRNAAAH
jgi:AraC-like DNA-binding protein